MATKTINDQNWCYKKLNRHGYKRTLGRDAILETLMKTNKHLSAKDIYKKIHLSHPSVGLTSIYRTLEVFFNIGLIFRFEFGDGHARYELAGSPGEDNHHHHLVCNDCNKVIDYKDFINEEVELLTRTEKGLSKKYDFKIENHLMQFYGLCNKCKS